MIISVMKRECQHPASLMTPIRTEMRNFVRSDLVEQEGISNAMHPKAVAHTDDVTLILGILYQPQYLNTFSNLRMVLNLTLYILLVTDLCGRGADIARHPLRPEYMCLRWEDITFYSFQCEEDDSFDIQAQIKVKWSKGQSLDAFSYRIIPLPALLPTSMALQDTLRMLLTLALMEGVFLGGVQRWEDLFSLRLPTDVAKTGRLIAMKPEMLQVPVLRRMQKHKMSNDPVQTINMQSQIRRLGQFCGFEHRLIAYCFRRGVAYILAEHTTQENRKFLVGHRTNSKVYSAYQSRVSTVDFSALFRGIEERPVNVQGGISLNRSNAPPLRVSEAGQQVIAADEEVQAAFEDMELIHASIKEKHTSLVAASRSSDPLWESFQQASTTYGSAVKAATKRIYKQEYVDHFQQLTTSFLPSQVDKDGSLDTVQDGPTHDESPLFVAENGAEESLSSFDTEEAVDQALDLIDPRLCGDQGDWQASEQDFIDEMVGAAELSPMDTVQIPATTASVAAIDGHDTADMAIHGRAINILGRGKNRVLTQTGVSAYVDFVANMEGKGTEADLSKYTTEWYSVCHPMDMFPLGQEPPPGTFNCRFCNKDLAQFHHPYEHTATCAKKDALERGQAILDSLCPVSKPCEYQACGSKNIGQFVVCGKTFTTLREQGEHMRDHVRVMTKKDGNGNKVPTCFFGDCALNPERGRLNRNGPDFVDEDERLAHVWSHHHVNTLKAVGVTYCEYCCSWLLEPYKWNTHAALHLDDAQSIIHAVGYCGVQAGRNIIPRLCPFCFHDEALAVHVRVTTYAREGHLTHTALHLEEMKDNSRQCPCYPATCTKSTEMDAVQMRGHLNTVHDLDLPARATKSRKKAAVSNDQDTPRKVAKITEED